MIKDELKNMTKEELIAEYERLNDKYVIAEVVKRVSKRKLTACMR